MRELIWSYRKRWWVYGALLGASGSTLLYYINVLIRNPDFSDFIAKTTASDFFSIFLATLFLAVGSFLPVYLISDLLSHKSSKVLLAVCMFASIALATVLILLRLDFEIDVETLLKAWNVYLSVFVMGLLSAFGWMKSRQPIR
jgi:ABC-type Fe3+-siderophore transport system permease subunit